MRVPFLELRKQYLELKDALDAAVLRVLDSGWYVLGQECKTFEESFKHYLVGDEEGFVIGVNSGTDALKLSLIAVGVKHGDEVVTVANTAIPTVAAICSIGAIPVFCDVDPLTWLMDPRQIEPCLTTRTRAIVPVHLYGTPCEMTPILAIAKKYGLSVVEDVAQAVGAEYKNSKCGTFGDCGAFSFYPSKNLGACGDAGAIFVKSESTKDALLKLRNYGQSSKYVADLLGGENSRLDEMQAAILEVKLSRLDAWNGKRRDIVQLYLEKINALRLPLHVQHVCSSMMPARHLFVIKVDGGGRDRLAERLGECGIGTLAHYPLVIYQQEAFSKFNNTVNPVAEDLCASVLSLPFHPYLIPEDVSYVVDCLAKSLT